MANNRNAPSSSTPSSSAPSSRPGVPLRPAPSRTPLTPRLAQDPTSSTQTPSLRPKVNNNHKHLSAHATTTRITAQDAASNITPLSMSAKTRPVSLIAPTPPLTDNAPSHGNKRPLVISPTNSEHSVRRPQLATSHRAKSVVGSTRPVSSIATRPTLSSRATHTPTSTPTPTPTIRGFVRPPDTASSIDSTLQPHMSASSNVTPLPCPRPTSAKVEKDSSSMFFHASEAKSQPVPSIQIPKLRKAPSFLHVNGQHQDLSPGPLSSPRSSSPTPSNISAVTDLRSPRLFVQSPLSSDNPLTPLITSPSLSAVSARTNYFTTPNSPPKNNIHLSYRKGASQIFALGGPPLPFHPSQQPQQEPSATSLPPSHLRTSSLSSIDTGSPEPTQWQSRSVPMVAGPVAASIPPNSSTPVSASFDAQDKPDISTTLDAPQTTDIHAEARRERKVLDLEISNSSLLAINKSLERELRKQKAELKRFRRLSRAGQFMAPQSPDGNDLSTLDKVDDLPDFDEDDEGARPSSPFHSQPDDTDYSDEESTNSSTVPLSPGARADRDAAQRAKDETRLRLDLSRHRELLLDTQRMNQSVQRCLYRTEGLIKDGKKALDYQVPYNDVKLGGRILSEDDYEEKASQADQAEMVYGVDEHFVAVVDFGEPDRRSVGSEMDSGIDLMAKRETLTMARDNPHHSW